MSHYIRCYVLLISGILNQNLAYYCLAMNYEQDITRLCASKYLPGQTVRELD